MTSNSDSISHENTPLALALQERSRGATKHELAREAGVSVKTISEVLAGTYATDPVPSGDPQASRQRRGYVEALTRLSIFLLLEPEKILPAYGIDLSWKGVKTAIERVRRKRTYEHGQSDPVLDAIASRDGIVQAGILVWPPFVKEGEDLNVSWGSRYTRRLLGALNPLWEYKPMAVETITDAIEGVTKGDYDLVFGIYETPYRRLRGLDFVHLPGIGIPLGALSAVKGLTWRDITSEEERDTRRLHALVIEEEVGHLFLAGACGYVPQRNLTVIQEGETRPLVTEFAKAYLQGKKRNEEVIFVADRLTCQRVSRELTIPGSTWQSQLPGGLSDRKTDLEQLVDHQLLGNLSKGSTEDDLVPTYRLGIAVRIDAPQWQKLLQSAQTDELFRNSLPMTANEYCNLIKKEGLDLAPLELSELPPEQARNFSEQFEEGMGETREEEKSRWQKRWMPYRQKIDRDLAEIRTNLEKYAPSANTGEKNGTD